jgi:hypothetical protein
MNIAVALHCNAGGFLLARRVEQAELDFFGVPGPHRKIGTPRGEDDSTLLRLGFHQPEIR